MPSLQQPSFAFADDAAERLAILEDWFAGHGIIYDREAIQLRPYLRAAGGGPAFGVVAKRNLRVGETVCKLSKDALLSVKTCGICDILEEADLVGILGLAFAVMYEMALGQASPFYGYLQSLPSGEHLPIFWSDEELRELRGSDLEAAIVADKAYLLDDYKTHVVPVLDRHPMVFADRSRFTLEHFAQATSLVTSRAFEVDAFHGDSLVPLADLFNHKTAGEHVHFEADSDVCPLCGTNGPCWCDATSTSTEDDYDDDESRPPSLYDPEEWTTASEGSDNQFAASDVHDDSADILEMTVIRKCPAFSEVFNTYGDHSNAALITKYGFAEENNQFDVVSLRMDEIMDEIARSTYGAGYTTRIEFWKEQGRGIVTAVTAAAAEADDVGTKEPNDDSESWADDFSEAASIHSEAREDEQDDFHFSFLGKASPTLLMFLLVLHAPSVLMRTFIKSPQTFQRYVEQVAMGGWRIFSSQPEQIKGASRSEQVHAAGASPLERAVSSTLVSLAKARLQRFPNSLQHDNARLKALSGLPSSQKWALILRIGEKQILSRAMKTYSKPLLNTRRGGKNSPSNPFIRCRYS